MHIFINNYSYIYSMGRKSKTKEEKAPKVTLTLTHEAYNLLNQQKNMSKFVSEAILKTA